MLVVNIKLRNCLRELLLAIAILFNSICFFISELTPSVSDFGDALVVVMILIGTITCFMDKKIKVRTFLLINGTVLLWILGSFVVYDFHQHILFLLTNFLVWGIFIAFYITLEYDVQKTLNIALLMASVVLLVDFFYKGPNVYDEMTWTYSVFPCMCVSFAHMIYCKGQLGKLRWLLYLPAILMLFRYLVGANRGGWVSLIVLAFLLTAKKGEKDGTTLRNRVVWSLLFLTAIVFAVLFYDWIIITLYKIMDSQGIRIYSIDKMYRGILADDVTNNRVELYQYAWNGFLASPIWGNGIGSFVVKYGTWPHNFVLQLLYEGGILMFLLVVIPLAKIVLFVLKSNAIPPIDYAMFVCLFAISVPKVLVTSELWTVQCFWLLLAFGMMRMPYFKNNMLRLKR